MVYGCLALGREGNEGGEDVESDSVSKEISWTYKYLTTSAAMLALLHFTGMRCDAGKGFCPC